MRHVARAVDNHPVGLAVEEPLQPERQADEQLVAQHPHRDGELGPQVAHLQEEGTRFRRATAQAVAPWKMGGEVPQTRSTSRTPSPAGNEETMKPGRTKPGEGRIYAALVRPGMDDPHFAAAVRVDCPRFLRVERLSREVVESAR